MYFQQIGKIENELEGERERGGEPTWARLSPTRDPTQPGTNPTTIRYPSGTIRPHPQCYRKFLVPVDPYMYGAT